MKPARREWTYHQIEVEHTTESPTGDLTLADLRAFVDLCEGIDDAVKVTVTPARINDFGTRVDANLRVSVQKRIAP